MVDTDSYKELMDAIAKLLGGMPEEESEDAPEDAPERKKKKGKTLTIISISKAKPGELKIPRAAKGEEEDVDE